MCAKLRSERYVAWGLGLALFGLVMFGWNGVFHSSDGISMYAVADSLARYGRLDTEQIRWTGLQQGMFGPDGRLYSRKAPGTSILALPLVGAGLVLPGLGPVHTALLLMPLATAATAILLYFATRRAFPELPGWTGGLVVLAWGLGSPAWPYAKTFFSEPLAALATIGALERLLALEGAESGSRRELRAALGLGLWLALGLLTRLAQAIVLPVFGVALLILMGRRYGRNIGRWPVRLPVAWGGPLIASVLILAAYNQLRFGSPLVSGYLPEETFSAVWWQGLLGLSVSPGRGLLWYAPWLVLAIAGAVSAWRRQRLVTGTAIAVCLVYWLVYAKWHMWHGGYCWGPRFLVVILPLLAWLAVPAARRWPRVFFGLSLLGIITNLIGVAWDFDPHQDVLVATGLPLFDPRTFFDLHYAQIPGMLGMARLDRLDLMWMANGQFQPGVALPALALAGIGMGAAGLAWSGRRPARPVWITLVVALLSYGLLWQAKTVQSPGYNRVGRAVEDYAPPNTTIWHNDHAHIGLFLNAYRGRAPVTGLLETGDSLGPAAARRLDPLAGLPRPVWVVNRGRVEQSGVLDVLASQHRGKVDAVGIATALSRADAAAETSRLLKANFYFDTPDWQPLVLSAELGPGGQPLLGLTQAYITPPARPGDLVAVRLQWQALQPLSTSYQVWVQLTTPDGGPLALQVGPPQNGNAPTTDWQPGQSVIDVHAFRLPENAPAGEYEFLISLQPEVGSERLTTPDGRDQVQVGPIIVPTREENHES